VSLELKSTLKFTVLSLFNVVVVVVIVVVVGDQGPEPRPRLALQQLGLLYILFSRSSHCCRQMSPRPTRRERGNFNGRERVAENFT
jgi:hypothetical protein